jgi:hypothetical protein
LAAPKIITTLVDKEAPVEPATTANVVTTPSLAAKIASLRSVAFLCTESLHTLI